MNKRAIQDITNFIFINDKPGKSDIILVPGTSKSGIVETAARLYHEGYAPYILPSGLYSSKLGRFAGEKIDNPRYAGDHATDFAYCRHILMENGVPDEAILCEAQATNTMENAAFSAKVLKEAGIVVNRAILCCQSFHARRAFLSYACHFPEAELLVVPTDTQGISRENWFEQETSYRKVLGEVEKCGKYFAEYQGIDAALCKSGF